MSYLINLIGACSDDSSEFHGYRVRIRDLAVLITEAVEREGIMPREMSTPEGVAELIRLLRGWSLVRTHDTSPARNETTSNAAYVAAPSWLRDMLAGTRRQENQIVLTDGAGASGTAETTYVSSVVPGFHTFDDLPVDEDQAVGKLADELLRRTEELPPGATMPRVLGLTSHFERHYNVDLGTIEGVPHRSVIYLPGGQHRSSGDITAAISEVLATLTGRMELAGEAKSAITAITKDVGKKIRLLPAIKMGEARVTTIKQHASGTLIIDAEVDIIHPDHSRLQVVNSIQTSATRDAGSSKWRMWNPFLGNILTNVRRTLAAGTQIMIDPVVEIVLGRLPRDRREHLLQEIMAKPGETAEHMSLKDTQFNRLRVLNGVIGGTVDLAPGVTWVDGSLRIKTSLITLPGTIIAASVGRPIRTIVEHEIIPDARIVSVREVKAAYYFVTDLNRQPFESNADEESDSPLQGPDISRTSQKWEEKT